MVDVDRAYNQVRRELAEVGWLAERFISTYRDLCITLPSRGEAGYVFESNWQLGRLGFRPGVIYLPSDMPQAPRVPGSTLIGYHSSRVLGMLGTTRIRNSFAMSGLRVPWCALHQL